MHLSLPRYTADF